MNLALLLLPQGTSRAKGSSPSFKQQQAPAGGPRGAQEDLLLQLAVTVTLFSPGFCSFIAQPQWGRNKCSLFPHATPAWESGGLGACMGAAEIFCHH